MKTIELFSGTCSFSNVASRRGYDIFTVDNDPQHDTHICGDIREIDPNLLPSAPEFLWASPPCQGFSVAVIGRNWHKNYTPKTDTARLAVELVEETLHRIEAIAPKWWFIENPRGMLRKLPIMEHLPFRHTVTYCQYGDTRQKPTDVWTNAHWWHPRAACGRGAPCHEAAPRGSRTGTQGIKGAKNRSRIPTHLFEEIFNQYDEYKRSKLITSQSTLLAAE